MKANLCVQDLWQFSLKTYQQSVVQDTLLHWQNNYQLNVNLCLLLSYLTRLNYQLSTEQVQQLSQCAEVFDSQVLRPQRHIRAYLKQQQHHLTHYSALRQEALAFELSLEKQQQQQLVDLVNQFWLTPCEQPHNLALYLPSELQPLKADLDQALSQT